VKPLFPAALAIALATAGVGHAASSSNRHTSVKVVVYGINLSRPDGAARVLRRLDRAATEACGADTSSLREYRLVVARSDCHAASLDRAVAQLDAPAVTALYNEETPPLPLTRD
jgi:UrcA family protein